jgi:hypothetical protein
MSSDSSKKPNGEKPNTTEYSKKSIEKENSANTNKPKTTEYSFKFQTRVDIEKKSK